MALGVLSLDDGTHARCVAKSGDAARIVLVDGHDALLLMQEGLETWSVYTVDGPERVTKLATLARPLETLTVSRDRTRVVANVADYRADAWMSKVVRP
jgi:hypothetical protein